MRPAPWKKYSANKFRQAWKDYQKQLEERHKKDSDRRLPFTLKNKKIWPIIIRTLSCCLAMTKVSEPRAILAALVLNLMIACRIFAGEDPVVPEMTGPSVTVPRGSLFLELSDDPDFELKLLREETLQAARAAQEKDFVIRQMEDLVPLLAKWQRAILGAYFSEKSSKFSRSEYLEVKAWRMKLENSLRGYWGNYALKDRLRSNNAQRFIFNRNDKYRLRADSFVPNSIHEAYDIFAPRGTAVYAYAGGIVLIARDGWLTHAGRWIRGTGFSLKSGNGVLLYHPESSCYSFYVHLQAVLVNPGDIVSPGSQIGTVGTTGFNATVKDPHLHFVVKENDENNDLVAVPLFGHWVPKRKKGPRPEEEKRDSGRRIEPPSSSARPESCTSM